MITLKKESNSVILVGTKMHKNPAFVVTNIESLVLLILVWVPTPSAAQALEQAFVGCLGAVRCGQDVEDISQI